MLTHVLMRGEAQVDEIGIMVGCCRASPLPINGGCAAREAVELIVLGLICCDVITVVAPLGKRVGRSIIPCRFESCSQRQGWPFLHGVSQTTFHLARRQSLAGHLHKKEWYRMSRSRRYLRSVRRRAIQRKQRIIKEQDNYWHYKYAGELSKGKIHCSCPMCRRKSYDEAKIGDIRKAQKNIDQLMEIGPIGVREANKIAGRTKGDQKKSIKGSRKESVLGD